MQSDRKYYNSVSPQVGSNRAARIVGVNPTTIQRWVDAGKLPSRRTLGGHRRIAISDLKKIAKREQLPFDEAAAESAPLIERTRQRGGIADDAVIGGGRKGGGSKLANSRVKGKASDHALTVLAVDDDRTFLDWFAMGLEAISRDSFPLEILRAESGFEAGQIIVESRPAVVFLDVRMPGIGGTEICKLIKRNSRTRAIRIFGITAVRDEAVIEEFVNAGAEWVFRKPVDMSDVKVILREVLRNEAVMAGMVTA